MKIKIQLVLESENDQSNEIHVEDVIELDKKLEDQSDIGLSLNESKELLSGIQKKIIKAQIEEYIRQNECCAICNKKMRSKGHHTIKYRTLFGNINVKSPRFYNCKDCHNGKATFSPLKNLIQDHNSPELKYLETKWASLISFGMSVKLLKNVLPIDSKFNTVTLRNHLHDVAERDEANLGEENHMYASGCINEIESLPKPDGPIIVGIDGGYVKDAANKQNHFEVIVGKSIPRDKPTKCFGFVQCHDTKPKRRLYEMLKSQGMQMNQQITFLSDGGETVRDLQLYMSPEAEHILEWFHITMRITVLNQFIKGLIKINQESGEKIQKDMESAKWYLWHGNVERALEKLEDVIFQCEEDFEKTYPQYGKLERHLDDFFTYITNNRLYITDYGERWRNGERISTGFVESTVNDVINKRYNKKQQMQWSKRGAHLLLQTRTRVLNKELAEMFRVWYPNFQINDEESENAA